MSSWTFLGLVGWVCYTGYEYLCRFGFGRGIGIEVRCRIGTSCMNRYGTDMQVVERRMTPHCAMIVYLRTFKYRFPMFSSFIPVQPLSCLLPDSPLLQHPPHLFSPRLSDVNGLVLPLPHQNPPQHPPHLIFPHLLNPKQFIPSLPGEIPSIIPSPDGSGEEPVHRFGVIWFLLG
jgi:hypothetical protein